MQRIGRVFISLLCLGVPLASAIWLRPHDNPYAVVLPVAVFVGFYLLAGLLQTLIALRLVVLHDVRRLVFDISIWLMVATLVALPLGVARLVANWIPTADPAASEHNRQLIMVRLAVFFYFQLLPVFVVAESALKFAASIVRNYKRRIAKARLSQHQ